MATFEYANRSFDTVTMPEATLMAFLVRGARVVFSNEAMSRANAEITKRIRAAAGDDKKKVSTDEITAWREANEIDYDAILESARDELYTKALAGELGLGRGSDGLSTAERQRHEAAEETLVELYAELSKKNGKTMVPFLTINAHKAALGHKGKATAEMVDYVAAKKRERIEAFLAGIEPGGKFEKHARKFTRKLDAIREAAKAEKAPSAEVAGDSMDELAA